jgi:signal transduction histidine kinase
MLVVEDDGNGNGNRPGASSRPLAAEAGGREDIEAIGVGVAGMRERLTQLKGRLEFITGAQGTIVRAFIPCMRPATRRAQLQAKEAAVPRGKH